MFDPFIYIIVFFLIMKLLSLSGRLKRCEAILSKINSQQKKITTKEVVKEKVEPKKTESLTTVTPPQFSQPMKAEKPTPQPKLPKQKPPQRLLRTEPWKIPSIVKENWMGIFGSMAVVIGTVFFGLTADIMQQPEVRVGIMMFGSMLLLGIGAKIKSKEQWVTLSGWLKSIAGAVVLFATLGAGGIEGLQFIESPIYALACLSLGISLNIFLAFRTPSQSVASFHVILSILALCIVPQAAVILPIGALIACAGLVVSYRSKWDLHLLLIVVTFAVQNTVWTFSQWEGLSLSMNYLAIGCSLTVSAFAAMVHYSKKYQTPKFEVFPLLAHIANWGFLGWNIWLHFENIEWTYALLGALSVTGFLLARVAKKKGIHWLYLTDTIIAQLLAMGSLVSLAVFSVNPIDLSMLVFGEIILFVLISQLQKEDSLTRVGYFLQACCSFVVFVLLIDDSFNFTETFYLRAGVMAAVNWGYYFIITKKSYPVDDLHFILNGKKDVENSISIMTIFGTSFFILAYSLGIDSTIIQCVIVAVIAALAYWRTIKEDASCNIALIMSLILVHLIQWGIMMEGYAAGELSMVYSRVDLWGILLLDGFLIFGNFLQIKIWKKNLHQYVNYAMWLQVAFLTYICTEGVSALMIVPIFLGYSLVALEISRLVHLLPRHDETVKRTISESTIHVGIAFLIAFISRFVTINLQVDPDWNGISLRVVTEVLAILTFVYWLVFSPKDAGASRVIRLFNHYLLEGLLGFLTLTAFTEIQDIWRPFVWSCLAMGLMLGSLKLCWARRLTVYSWGYFIASIVHVAFVTSALNMPTVNFVEVYHLPAICAVIVQLIYSVVVYQQREAIRERRLPIDHWLAKVQRWIFEQPSLSVILPVFLGIALLFAYNFQKAILTLLWVGLISLYLGIGLFLKSKRSIQIAMTVLAICGVRLVMFDLVQSDLAVRALVFIGVGFLMLGISVVYKKFKYRIQAHEQV
jgi:hypothetical protein